jgi:hypothetical protein
MLLALNHSLLGTHIQKLLPWTSRNVHIADQASCIMY